MKFGVIVFPGSNCDLDAYYMVRDILSCPVSYIWHEETSVKGYDCLILPGGFSYGDYLRPGAIARFSPVMDQVVGFAANGGIVIGICNGFQILTEANLLPGALYINNHLQFRCKQVNLRVENSDLGFTRRASTGRVLRMPVAHGDGNYYIDPDGLRQLEERKQVVFRYVDEEGEPTAAANPNGSVANIAGICNDSGNVLGLMPHPERAVEDFLGSTDGRLIFDSILS